MMKSKPPLKLDKKDDDFHLSLVIELAREAAKRDHDATEFGDAI
jgi:hypothetical protein